MLDRRQFLATVGSAALATALPGVGLAQAGADGDLAKLLDRFFYDGVDESPQRAASLGLDKGDRAGLKSRLDDRSAAEKARRLDRSKQRLAALKGVDRAALGREGRIDYDVVAYQLQTEVDGGTKYAFGSVGNRFSPYVISQLTGAYQDIPDFLDNQHKVETKADAEAYLDRLQAFPLVLDQDVERARTDVAAGVMPPDFVQDTTLQQLQALTGVAPGQSVLVQSLARKAKAAGIDGDWSARAEAIVASKVFPALERQSALVRGWRSRAPADAGVWRLPDGDAYYTAALAAATTTTLAPAEVHQLGLDQVADISGRIDAILKARGLTKGTVADRLTVLNDDPAQLYPNTDEGRAALIEQLNAQIAAVWVKLPQAFRDLPKAKVEVKRVPPFIQDGAPNGYYQRAALDGSRPAIYFINLKDNHDWPKFGLPTLTYHEAVPGHHLQLSIQQQSQAIPLIRRTAGFSAYSEGWALYAEQLADELGMYQGDDLGRAGFLQSFLFRAARLVVDTGVHAKRWSRNQAIDYMVGVTGYTRGRVQREVDRYCTWPGQACSYKVGHTVWTRLRERAKARLGPRFEIKDFHDAGLEAGSMPLTVLEGVIDGYITDKAA